MKVYIVRHGQIPNNALKRHTNPYEDLTDLGIRQAEELRDTIRNINFDVILVSPFLRAIHTAQILNINQIKMIIDDRLKERDCGNLSGKPLEENDERIDYWDYFSIRNHGTSENIKPFFKRVYNFLDELKTKDYERVLIVAHSGISKAFSGYFEGIGDGKFLNRGLKNCEIKEYELDIKNSKVTKGIIIAGFATIGKSYLGKKYINVIDLESSNYKHYSDDLNNIPVEERKGINREINNEWPMNYYKAIMEAIASYDVVLVQLKPEHFDYFDKHNIRYCIAYPDINDWQEVLNKCINRGNNDRFIKRLKQVFIPYYEDAKKRDYDKFYIIKKGKTLEDDLIEDGFKLKRIDGEKI